MHPDDFSVNQGALWASLVAWGRHWGLQEADAQDVAQMVLLRLAVKLRQFVYDPASGTAPLKGFSDLVDGAKNEPGLLGLPCRPSVRRPSAGM